MEAFRKTAQAATVSFAVVGPYSGNPADGYTHSAIFGLADLEALERFMYEPAHREADFIVHPHMATFDGFDVSDEYDPDLEAKVMAIRRRRRPSYPELAAFLSGYRRPPPWLRCRRRRWTRPAPSRKPARDRSARAGSSPRGRRRLPAPRGLPVRSGPPGHRARAP